MASNTTEHAESLASAVEADVTITEADNLNQSTSEQSFDFISIDPNERLPCPPAPQNEQLSNAQQLVSWAISSKHENAPTLDANTSKEHKEKNNPIIEAAQCHSLLISLLSRKSDPPLLCAILHALRTSNHGRELDRLVSHSKLHAHTIHLIMKLDPFVPGPDMLHSLRELDVLRRKRSVTSYSDKKVQISEESIRHKEDVKYIVPNIPFFGYDVADVHLYLIVALVSNNSLLGVSAVRAVWKLLTDFGSKWIKDQDEHRKLKRLANNQKAAADKSTPPPAKRRKCDESAEEKPSKDEPDDAPIDIPEGEKLVPGTNGLSVNFVKDNFYNKIQSENDENICSDCLPMGRVKRLLLTLVNIFRLNHRSKNDILHEMLTSFPHYKTAPAALHRWYINMCLQLVHIAPTLEGPVVNLLVDRALEMDVQIKINDKGSVFLDALDDDEGDLNVSSKKRSYQIISQETLSTGKSNNTNVVDDSDEISEIAERLDNLMNILCQRIEKLTTFAPDSVSEALAAVVNARRLYRHLDDIFDKKVRTTHRSKFVPFIFFVLFGREHDALEAVGKSMAGRNSASPSNVAHDLVALQDQKGLEINDVVAASISQTDFLYRGFCAKLIDLFYNPTESGELPSQTLVCTLASFVSRATYVCPETVCETVAAILQWTEAYIEAHTESQGTPALVRRQSSGLGNTLNQRDVHALFYTACQSAFYIMCFRGAEALHYYQAAWRHRDDPESEYASPESVNLGAKRWKTICSHPLQPLKYCLESVRVEFLHMAEDLHLFVEDSAGYDSGIQEEEAKDFIRHLWAANNQKSHGDKSKIVTPKRKRSSIISTAATQEKKRIAGGVGGLGKGSNPLDSYFPFDPYLLQSSYRHVHPFYRNWEDCILTMEELDDATTNESDAPGGSGLAQGDSHELEDDDDNSIVSDSGDEEEDNYDEEESDDNDDDESKSKSSPLKSKAKEEGNGLEIEIRRCRAMSTGSQASW